MSDELVILVVSCIGFGVLVPVFVAWMRRSQRAHAAALDAWLDGFRARGWTATSTGPLEYRLSRERDGRVIVFEQGLVETGPGEGTGWAPVRTLRVSPAGTRPDGEVDLGSGGARFEDGALVWTIGSEDPIDPESAVERALALLPPAPRASL